MQKPRPAPAFRVIQTAVDRSVLDDEICLTCQAVPLTAIELDV